MNPKFILFIVGDRDLRSDINGSRMIGRYHYRIASDIAGALPMLDDRTREWALLVTDITDDALRAAATRSGTGIAVLARPCPSGRRAKKQYLRELEELIEQRLSAPKA